MPLAPSHVTGVLLGAGGAAALGAYWLPALAKPVARLRRPLGIRDRLERPEEVALTFDDGPHAEGTPAVLEALAAAGARATFFLVGEQVERRPGIAREIAAGGHEIALHCHRHRALPRLPPRQVREDLRRAVHTIGEATGIAPRLYRPPYGVLNAAALAAARREGWEPILWSRDGCDWSPNATPESITARLMRDAGPGDILLLHDSDAYSAPGSWRRTAAALPTVLAEIERRSLRPSFV